MAERILVLGGTGTLGIPVVKALGADGHYVRVLARDGTRAKNRVGPDVEVMEGDAVHPSALRDAMEGITAVHVSLPARSELHVVEQVLALGATTGLGRVSYVSGTSVSEENRWFDLIDKKWRAEQLLRRSPVPHTVFCPTWVMEVIPNFMKRNRAVIIEGKSPPAFHFFAAEDFGAMVAAAYRTEECMGRRLFVHGPEALTLSQAIQAYRQACCPENRITRFRPWQARLMGRLTRQESLRDVADLIQYFDQTDELGDPTEANAILGTPSTTLGEWIHRRSSTR